LRFFDVVETGLSTADPNIAARYREAGRAVREIEVPCLTLAELMAPYAEIDVHWLKIDVEGYETAVLQGWTSAVRPWIVVVESTAPSTQAASHRDWEELVLAHGYAFAYFDGLNRFYIRVDHEELRAAFAHGPSVFDRFALSGTATSTFASRLRIEVDSARDRAEELKREADAFELRARDASQRMDAALRHIAAMEATISWRVTAPLRWLSHQRNAASARSARSLRAAAALAVRAIVSAARRSGLYSKIAPWLRSRYPRLWKRAKRVAIAAPAGASRDSSRHYVALFATRRWVPRTTRDATIVGVASSGATCDCPRAASRASAPLLGRASRGRSRGDARCRAVLSGHAARPRCAVSADRGVRTPRRRTLLRRPCDPYRPTARRRRGAHLSKRRVS
jgi:hypothetical protein